MKAYFFYHFLNLTHQLSRTSISVLLTDEQAAYRPYIGFLFFQKYFFSFCSAGAQLLVAATKAKLDIILIRNKKIRSFMSVSV